MCQKKRRKERGWRKNEIYDWGLKGIEEVEVILEHPHSHDDDNPQLKLNNKSFPRKEPESVQEPVQAAVRETVQAPVQETMQEQAQDLGQKQVQEPVQDPVHEPVQELPSFIGDDRSLAGPGRSMLVQPGKGTLTKYAGQVVGAKEVDGKVKHVVWSPT